MKIEDVFTEIQNKSPRIVYVSGKTCTGKTTFTNEVMAFGYTAVELDKIVTSAVVVPFNVNPSYEAYLTAYRDQGPSEQVAAFVTAAKKEITSKLISSSVIIEGAIAKSQILKDVFSGELADFYFVYFHPIYFEAYKDRIRKRFVAGAANNNTGLPKAFWALVSSNDVDEFKKTLILNEGIEKAIGEYAAGSMQESEGRLTHFKESFPNLHVVEV